MSEKLSRSKRLRALFYPAYCPYCNNIIDRDAWACESCKPKLPAITYHRYAIGGVPCAAALPYTGMFARAAKRYKFGKKGGRARALAVPLSHAVREHFNPCDFDFVTCVPARRHYLRRGFPHAEYLARELAALLDLPFCPTLEQFKHNERQHTLKRSQREQNVRGVFRLLEKDAVRGKRILLVDDIITTGHTLGKCVRVLKRGKAQDVRCAALCTTIL